MIPIPEGMSLSEYIRAVDDDPGPGWFRDMAVEVARLEAGNGRLREALQDSYIYLCHGEGPHDRGDFKRHFAVVAKALGKEDVLTIGAKLP